MSKAKKKLTAYFTCYFIWSLVFISTALLGASRFAGASYPDDPTSDFCEEINISIVTIDQLPQHIKRAEKRYHEFIVAAANRYKLDAAMIKAIIMAESSYDRYAVSSQGAMGLMQLMPSTAKSLGIDCDPFNPEKNIQAGAKYFKQLLDQYNGRVKLALAAYNAGSANVMKYRGIPPFKVTRHYIAKVLTYYEYYKKEELV